MSKDDVDVGRRRFLTAATSVIGGVGAIYALMPFLASWKPSTRAQAAGAPVEVDITELEEGQQITVAWRGRPVWVVRRTQAMLDTLPRLDDENVLRDPDSQESEQPDFAKNINRSLKPEFFIAVGICTHLGCVPDYRPSVGDVNVNWLGGFFCPCHGSAYDLAGRVYRGVPAPLNLVIPPHQYISDTQILIGEDG